MLHLEQHTCLPSIDELLLTHTTYASVSGKIELAPLRNYVVASPGPSTTTTSSCMSPPQPIHPPSLCSLSYEFNCLPLSMQNLALSPPAAVVDHHHNHRRSRSENITMLNKEDPLRINYRESPPLPVSSTTAAITTLKRSASQPQRRYTCRYCQKTFIRPSSLRTHTYSHTGQKPFACTFEGCDKHFSVLSNMRRHMRRHRVTLPSDSDSSPSTTDS